jgi:hypothetical protein
MLVPKNAHLKKSQVTTKNEKLNLHFTTYLPTCCVIIIAEMTLFIDKRHFEASIMVALTSMLVMYTLYQSVAKTLPPAYMKMIDIWLLAGLILTIFVVMVLIAIEY